MADDERQSVMSRVAGLVTIGAILTALFFAGTSASADPAAPGPAAPGASPAAAASPAR